MKNNQKGVVLLEGLISILLFSFAMLGLIGMQANMIRMSANAGFRLQASMLANSMMGWASADVDHASCYNYTDWAAGACAESAITARIEAWGAEVQSKLPNTQGLPPLVTTDGDGILAVTVRWKQSGDDVIRNYTATTQIKG